MIDGNCPIYGTSGWVQPPSPWAKDDDVGAFLPSQERIAMMTKKFRDSWSEEEKYKRIYEPNLANIERGFSREEYTPYVDSLEDDPDYSWLEEEWNEMSVQKSK